MEMTIFYSPNDRESVNLVQDYMKKILPKVKKYDVNVKLVNVQTFGESQMRWFNKITKGKMMVPSAYVVLNNDNEEYYTNVTMIYKLILNYILLYKSRSVGIKSAVKSYANKRVEEYNADVPDFLEMERRNAHREDATGETMAGGGGDLSSLSSLGNIAGNQRRRGAQGFSAGQGSQSKQMTIQDSMRDMNADESGFLADKMQSDESDDEIRMREQFAREMRENGGQETNEMLDAKDVPDNMSSMRMKW